MNYEVQYKFGAVKIFFCIIDWYFPMLQNKYIMKTMYPGVTIEPQNLFNNSRQHFESETSNVERELFTCNDCGKCYNRKGNLGRHKRYECGKDKQFKCVFCPKSFFRRDKLCFHTRMCHQTDVWMSAFIITTISFY